MDIYAARTWPRQLGGGRCALPRRPRPPLPPHRVAEGRRGSGGGEGAVRDAGEAGGGTRDARRSSGAGKAEEVAGGSGVARSGVLAPAGPDGYTAGGNAVAVAVAGGVADASAGDGAAGVAVVVARREGRGGGEVGSKRPFASSARPRAYPPPKRRLVSATRRFPPGCGRGADDGGSAASPKKPAPLPPPSVGESGWPAAAVTRPIAGGGHHGQDAGALRSPEPSSRCMSVAAADGLLDTDSQGGSGSGGFGSGKLSVPAMRLLPKPTMVSAIRRFPPGCGRFTGLQPLHKSADKAPLKESKELSAAGGSSGLKKKKLIVKCPSHLGMKIASACTIGTINKPDDVAASILQDDGFLKALDDYERKLELKLHVSSDVPFVRCQRQHGTQNADARSKVKMMCKRFQFICKAVVQFVEQRSLKISRIDITADKVIRKLTGFTQHGPIIGNVPGVEIGDEFVYRVKLALVGLHRPYQGGIDITRVGNSVPVAISIVASGGYPDELSSSGELIYTVSGGKLASKKGDENQKLERGNLGLKNCIQMMTPVRVIHGFKSREKANHSRAKGASSFTYDGLYHVVDFWREGQAGSKVFKYKLQRIPGQPQLPYCSKTAHSSKTGIMC